MIQNTAAILRPTLLGGCVVSYCPIASSIGLRVLREGGNAIDAAVATGLALAVTYPQAGNLGGGGFMLIRTADQREAFLDYRELSPRAITTEHFQGDPSASVLGARSVAVPGTVAGFYEALRKYGTWAWDRTLAVPIDLAEKGFWITSRQGAYFNAYSSELARYKSTRDTFFPDGAVPLAGTLFCQPHLAWSLRQLAEQGPDAFYRGSISDRLVSEIAAGGGILDHEDLDTYSSKWRDPLSRTIFGRRITTACPPSGGGLVVLVALSLLEASGFADMEIDSVDRVDLLRRAFRVAFATRRRFIADPDAFPIAEAIAEAVGREYTSGSLEAAERELELPGLFTVAPPSQNTTHFCVLDSYGNAVSNTYTLNTLFGSKLTARGTGFLLNNSINDFSLGSGVPNWYDLVEGSRARLVGGRRATGSMSPTIVSDGTVQLVLGGSGGPHIPTMVTQTILRTVVDGLPLPRALVAPRVHHQFVPDQLKIEESFPSGVAESLAGRGVHFVRAQRLGIGIGIQRDASSNDRVFTMLDPRFNDDSGL